MDILVALGVAIFATVALQRIVGWLVDFFFFDP